MSVKFPYFFEESKLNRATEEENAGQLNCSESNELVILAVNVGHKYEKKFGSVLQRSRKDDFSERNIGMLSMTV